MLVDLGVKDRVNKRGAWSDSDWGLRTLKVEIRDQPIEEDRRKSTVLAPEEEKHVLEWELGKREIPLRTFRLQVAQKIRKCSIKELVERSEETQDHWLSSIFSRKEEVKELQNWGNWIQRMRALKFPGRNTSSLLWYLNTSLMSLWNGWLWLQKCVKKMVMHNGAK